MTREPEQSAVPRRPTLFVMVGLPGSGKTTLAKRLEREHGAVRLTKDDWMMTLFGRADLDDERAAVEALLWTTGARLLELGVDVVLDYGLWTRAEREHYRAEAEALGAQVRFQVLHAEPDELGRRLAGRNRRGAALDVPISPDRLAEYVLAFERPDEEETASWT